MEKNTEEEVEDTDIEDIEGEFTGLEDELGLDTPGDTREEETPQDRADRAVTDALLEKRQFKSVSGQTKKIHNISDAHTIVWQQIISDGRDNNFQVMSLLWCLLQPPKRIVKFGALNVTALRADVMQFMVDEAVKGERFEQLEDLLAGML